jgi:hypothetical protein
MFASPTVFRNRFPGDVPLPLPPLPPGEIKKPGRRLSDAFQPVPRQGLRALYGLVRRRPAAAPGPRIVGRIRCTTEVLRGVREAGCPVAHGRFRVMPPRPAGGAGDALKVPSCRPLPTCVRAGGGDPVLFPWPVRCPGRSRPTRRWYSAALLEAEASLYFPLPLPPARVMAAPAYRRGPPGPASSIGLGARRCGDAATAWWCLSRTAPSSPKPRTGPTAVRRTRVVRAALAREASRLGWPGSGMLAL